jgi:glutamate--cysteine ligase
MNAPLFYETPHLATAYAGPLHALEKKLLEKKEDIEQWFLSQWLLTPAPLYGSVDLRNAGFKLAPVDMNLFPAGFNNLNPDFFSLCVEAAKYIIEQRIPHARRILFIPESHTRNLFYWENVNVLLRILRAAGFEVRVGTLFSEATKISDRLLSDGTSLSVESIVRFDRAIGLAQFTPDFILLNNDLSEGIPDILQDIDQPILPPAKLGWSHRLKSEHFQYYEQVSREFSQLIQIDPWWIAPLFQYCGEINFMTRSGDDCLAEKVDMLFSDIRKKYDEFKISCQPYVVVKADAGTYGMAVMMVKSVDEIRHLNRKQRTAMSKSKGGQPVTRVIIQEGVYTFETSGKEEAVAEPVVYLFGERVIGGFYRVHKNRGIDENLNSPGMHFEPLAFAQTCHLPKTNISEDCQNRFYAYGVIARLSMLAAAREIKEQML